MRSPVEKSKSSELNSQRSRGTPSKGALGACRPGYEKRHKVELYLTAGNPVLAGDLQVLVSEDGIRRVVAGDKGVEKRVGVRVAPRVEIFDDRFERQFLIVQREAELVPSSTQQITKCRNSFKTRADGKRVDRHAQHLLKSRVPAIRKAGAGAEVLRARVEMDEQMEDRLDPGKACYAFARASLAEFGPERFRNRVADLRSFEASMTSQTAVRGKRRWRRTTRQFFAPIVELMVPGAGADHFSLPEREIGELCGLRFG